MVLPVFATFLESSLGKESMRLSRRSSGCDHFDKLVLLNPECFKVVGDSASKELDLCR